MGVYPFRAVQYGASRLELSAIKPENSRKINFIFSGRIMEPIALRKIFKKVLMQFRVSR